jgi:hypothetical protein
MIDKFIERYRRPGLWEFGIHGTSSAVFEFIKLAVTTEPLKKWGVYGAYQN